MLKVLQLSAWRVCLYYRSSISKLINALLSPYSHAHQRHLAVPSCLEMIKRSVSGWCNANIVIETVRNWYDLAELSSWVIKALLLLLRCNICLPRFFRCVCQQKDHYGQLCFQATLTRPQVVQSCVMFFLAECPGCSSPNESDGMLLVFLTDRDPYVFNMHQCVFCAAEERKSSFERKKYGFQSRAN